MAEPVNPSDKPKQKKKRKALLTPRQAKIVKNLASKGMTVKQAAIDAGYSENGAAQAGHNALKAIRAKMPEVLERHGLTDDAVIDKYLLPLLNANETKFFPHETESKDGAKRFRIHTRTGKAWRARTDGLDMLFRLKGSYAPKTLEEAQINVNTGIKVILLDVPRPGKQNGASATVESSNGHAGSNGNR